MQLSAGKMAVLGLCGEVTVAVLVDAQRGDNPVMEGIPANRAGRGNGNDDATEQSHIGMVTTTDIGKTSGNDYTQRDTDASDLSLTPPS